MRCFIVVKERSDAESWDWVLAGPGLHAAGSLGARGTEDAIIAAVGAAYDSLVRIAPVQIVVALPSNSRFWMLTDEIADAYPGVTVVPFVEDDADIRAEAVEALAVYRTGPLPPLVVATDGSAHRGFIGWGWLAGDGQHGFGRQVPNARIRDPQSLVVLAELQAIAEAVRALPRRTLTIRTDSRVALALIEDWLRGEESMPKGYETEHRAELAGLTRMHDDLCRESERLSFEWVRGHVGEALNEGADSLAKLARRFAEGTWGLTADEIPGRARAIAETFAAPMASGTASAG
ncbi:FtsQ [Nocardioidaceae bacterium Broad-1]|uniref:RNase H family protein n=1 Tax=Nocardioides luteus TaxID=1844 RepID=UPI0002028FD2|nr:RNase H family protein [Nocardioides luteus]EGD41459.1 FtsQ [Nocardioidaceae bacterium Broad-1]MBG6095031.1 ribonuclease HI [Nocardioides luteus]